MENGTFSPLPITLADFTVLRGEELLTSERYPFLQDNDLPADIDVVPVLFARSLPGGPATPKAYATLKNEIVDRLRAAGPLDGVYLDLHGAMNVAGMDDAEADLARGVRNTVGADALIVASMDLHGNITPEYIAQIDMLTAYRTAPHRDMLATRARAYHMLCAALHNQLRPQIACMPIPVLLSGEATRTDQEPGATLWASLEEIERKPGVLDASLFVGFAWVDEPRAHAAAVITGTDPAVIDREACGLAQTYWDARHRFNFGVPIGSINECITAALADNNAPIFISDSGDNVTAGAVGDISLFVERLLAHPVPSALVGSVADAETVTAAHKAGAGAQISVLLGGKLDPSGSQPLPLDVHVKHTGELVQDGGRFAALRIGRIDVVVTEHRCAFTTEADFLAVGTNPSDYKLVVVKLGYLFPDLLRIASAAYMALSPGASDLDLQRLPYRRIKRPMFPLDPEMRWQATTNLPPSTQV